MTDLKEILDDAEDIRGMTAQLVCNAQALIPEVLQHFDKFIEEELLPALPGYKLPSSRAEYSGDTLGFNLWIGPIIDSDGYRIIGYQDFPKRNEADTFCDLCTKYVKETPWVSAICFS
ncbi:MAG: hypothetical protein ABH849_02530 [Nanoarchaeota archaeon]